MLGHEYSGLVDAHSNPTRKACDIHLRKRISRLVGSVLNVLARQHSAVELPDPILDLVEDSTSPVSGLEVHTGSLDSEHPDGAQGFEPCLHLIKNHVAISAQESSLPN